MAPSQLVIHTKKTKTKTNKTTKQKEYLTLYKTNKNINVDFRYMSEKYTLLDSNNEFKIGKEF